MSTRFTHSLGFLSVDLVEKGAWHSKRLPEPFLDLSTCHGRVGTTSLPLLSAAKADSVDAGATMIELGLTSEIAQEFLDEEDLRHVDLLPAPSGQILGYEVLGFEWSGHGWHSPNCHNVADEPEGQDIEFTPLGLIENYEAAIKLADWLCTEESGAEPVSWFPVSVHAVAGRNS